MKLAFSKKNKPETEKFYCLSGFYATNISITIINSKKMSHYYYLQ